MGKKNDVELQLCDAIKERNIKYGVRDYIMRGREALDEDIDERIRRLDQYMLCRSMSEKDRIIFEDKIQIELRQRLEFDDLMNDFRKRIDDQCEEAEFIVRGLEDKLNLMCEEEEHEGGR